MLVLIPRPPKDCDDEHTYAIRAREKRSFQTVMDAESLLETAGSRNSSVRIQQGESELELILRHPIARGEIHEDLHFELSDHGARARSLLRKVYDAEGQCVRREEVDFPDPTIGLPEAAYPEVSLPYILGWFPHDQQRRSLFAWINDRFVARVYFEFGSVVDLRLGGRNVRAREALLYPDLNDWVPLPKIITRLSKPFLPKYRMWYELDAPYRLLRFEGPFGPPGAPEIVLERMP